MSKKNKKEEIKADDIIPTLTFEDGIMLMKNIYEELIENYAAEYNVGAQLPTDEIADHATEIIDNQIFRWGYHRQRTDHLMKQFDIRDGIENR